MYDTMTTVEEEKEEDRGFDEVSWNRLKNVVTAIGTQSAKLENLKSQFGYDKPSSENIVASNLAAEIENRSLRVSKLKKKIENLQKMYVSKNRSRIEVNEKIKTKNEDFQKLVQKTSELEEKKEKMDEKVKKQRKVIYVLMRLGARRKLDMIQDVGEIFKIEIDGGPASTSRSSAQLRECRCVMIDTIRGLHLPHISCIQAPGHFEIETTSAAGYLIHALDAISMILDYSYRYPIYPYQSTSQIFNPLDDQKIQLYGWKKRQDKDKFCEGIGLLAKNIVQLRADCGIPTPIADKTLLILFDWIRSVGGGAHIAQFERPRESVFSPACLFSNFKKPPTNGGVP